MTHHLHTAAGTGALVPAGAGERIWIVGDTVVIKASGEDTAGRLTVLECDAAPGGGPPPHVHERHDETFYVLEGEFELLIGDELRSGGPGTFAFVPRGTVHRFSCTSETTGRILITFTPGGMDGFFRESGRPALDDGPPPPLDGDEIARTDAAAERYGLRIVDWGG